ncbi:hypothetical protein EVC26_027 [Rhizobium phage RHph_I72]|nr:hypothetical protein EVC26_027 [Rhizobium phage RHph_I72]
MKIETRNYSLISLREGGFVITHKASSKSRFVRAIPTILAREKTPHRVLEDTLGTLLEHGEAALS